MRALAAFAELRLRGAGAAGLVWLVPAAFLGGLACARWAPGYDATTRAAAADGVALAACGGLVLLAVLILAATAFARDVRTGAVQALLAPPASRGALLAGGVAGHGVFAVLLLLATCLAASLGLDAGGLGSGARRAVRPLVAAEVLGLGEDGFAVLDRDHAAVRARFVVPASVGQDELVRIHLSPHGQMETGRRDDGFAQVSVHPPGGRARRTVTVAYKASVPFDAYVPAGSLLPGETAEVTVERQQGHWRLRFPQGSVEVGFGREKFAWNVVKCVACAAPLLLLAAAAGALGSARLGAGAATALVLFLGFLFAGRDVVKDGASFIVAQAEAQEAEPPDDHDPADEHGHDHEQTIVTPVQTALARGALVVLRIVPDATHFWRFGDLAQGRAVGGADVALAWQHGLPACAVVLAAGWLLLRRREFVPG